VIGGSASFGKHKIQSFGFPSNCPNFVDFSGILLYHEFGAPPTFKFLTYYLMEHLSTPKKMLAKAYYL
jgi:endo-1,4-beta-mannosidase